MLAMGSCPGMALAANTAESTSESTAAETDNPHPNLINTAEAKALNFSEFIQLYGNRHITYHDDTYTVEEAIELCEHLQQLPDQDKQAVIAITLNSEEKARQLQEQTEPVKQALKTEPAKKTVRPLKVVPPANKTAPTGHKKAQSASQPEPLPSVNSQLDGDAAEAVIIANNAQPELPSAEPTIIQPTPDKDLPEATTDRLPDSLADDWPSDEADAVITQEDDSAPVLEVQRLVEEAVSIEAAGLAFEELAGLTAEEEGVAATPSEIVVSLAEAGADELNQFEQFLAERFEPEQPAVNLADIREQAEHQTAEDSLAQLADLLAESDDDPELAIAEQLLREIAAELELPPEITAGDIAEVRLTPVTTRKILALLKHLGHQTPAEALTGMVARRDLRFVIEAIKHLAEQTQPAIIAEPYEFLSKLSDTPRLLMPLVRNLGGMVLLAARSASPSAAAATV